MLTLPVPDTMRVPGAKPGQAYMVEGDLYNIVERIKKEVSPDLEIIFRPESKRPFVVMERCHDGVHRMVSSYEELDQRVIEDLQYMLRVPFEQRFKQATDEIDAHNEKLRKFDPETENFERLAWNMQRALYKSGIVHHSPFASERRRYKKLAATS